MPNSSFEERGRFFSFRTLGDVRKWYGPGGGSSDYFYNTTKRRPFAHTGNGFVAIGTFTYLNQSTINQEYISIKLKSKLIKGQKYCVSSYVMRSGDRDFSYSHNKFEYVFTKRKISRFNKKVITGYEYYDLENGDTLLDSKNWVIICGVYTAQKRDKHIAIGKFDTHLRINPILDKKGKTQGRTVSAYYYLDDISVIPIGDERECNCRKIDTTNNLTLLKDTSPSILTPIVGVTTTLQNIFFYYDKSELLPQSYIELDKLLDYLQVNTEVTIEITGHTDNRGKESHNKTLSLARAKSVADYLIQKGIDKNRIIYKGLGSLKPTANNDTDEGMQHNRRVEFIIQKK